MNGNTAAQETNARRLGRAVRLFDPTGTWITPGAIGNMAENPRLGRALLRHVVADIAVHPTAGPVWAEIDWSDMPTRPTAAYWFGYWGGRS